MNGYDLSRQWFDFASKNKRRVKPIHHAIMFWIFERQNQSDWEEEFQLPTSEACEVLGISHKDTYQKAFKDLVDFGVIRLIQEAKGTYSARWISLHECPIYLPKKQVIQRVVEQVEHGVKDGVESAPIIKTIKTNKTSKTVLPPDVKNVEATQTDFSKNEKEEKVPEFNLTTDDRGVVTCQTLRSSCHEYFRAKPGTYPDQMYAEFIQYWSVPNSKNKPKWYTEKTRKGGGWHLPSRLATWFKNYKPTKPLYQEPNRAVIPERLRMEVYK